MVFKKIIFQNRYVALETPSRPPPPFMAKTILNFQFDYLTPSLICPYPFQPPKSKTRKILTCVSPPSTFSRVFLTSHPCSLSLSKIPFCTILYLSSCIILSFLCPKHIIDYFIMFSFSSYVKNFFHFHSIHVFNFHELCGDLGFSRLLNFLEIFENSLEFPPTIS